MLKDIRTNPLMLTDSYNLSHERLKESTDWEVSHVYNRAKGMILYGFSEIVNSVLDIQITHDMIDQAEEGAKRQGLRFPRELFERVVNECNGYFPLRVQSLPEGIYCPPQTPFAQIRNTVEGFGELVTWLEGVFLKAYFPSTAATQALRMRRYLEQKKAEYQLDSSFMIRLHSFGFRGYRTLEGAYFGGTAWNLFLFGTDDFHTMMHTPNAKVGSIPALAHKVTQQFDDEYEGFKHAIDESQEEGIVALVIDTYDSYRVINDYLVPLAMYAERKGVHIVLRPDSGDTWEQAVDIHRIVDRNKFTNVSVIIGEGMTFENVKKCDAYLEQHGVPLEFVSYGVGGGFYNYIERDTLGFAMKTAYSNGKPRMKFSEVPLKRSTPDIVAVTNKDGELMVDLESNVGMFNLNNLYYTIYEHTNKTPLIEYADWEETRERGLEQDMSQHIIYKSEDIRNLVKGFKKIYA